MKWTGKRFYLAISITVVLLYLISVSALLVRSAYSIQTLMLTETSEICAKSAENIAALGSKEESENTRAEQIFRYQKVMADNELALSGTYPFRCVSALGTNQRSGEMPVYSRNMILAEITWEDGTVERIPMVFARENSADVAQILVDTPLVGENGFWVTGYWQDDLFYIQHIYTGYIYDYESFEEPPEGTKTETIHAVFPNSRGNRRGAVNATNLELTTCLKYYGSKGNLSPFVKQWEADDALLEELRSRGFTMEGLPVLEPDFRREHLSRTIFQTKIIFRKLLPDYAKLCGGGYMHVAYLVEFSPIALAWGQLWSSGLPLILLVLFVLAWLFLNSTYNYVRRQELRTYQDEITRQTQALEYARNAEKSRREMTSAIAHELKTPIAVLSSYAEALQENIDAEKQSHYLTVIREETAKMDQMVLELLDLSRLEAGKYKLKRENIDLEALAKEIIDPLMPAIEEKQLNLVWQVGEPMVDADRYRLGQVVENFMTNAIRHTPEGGKIILRIGMERETFSVENQGKQIPMEQLSKVWETFWQGDASRNERGSGLGLAICRTIVTLHGGSCKVENTAAGVRFSISLSEEKKLYQLGRMPQEERVELEYPIARWYTTPEQVMKRLELLHGRELQRELKAGNIRVGDAPVTDKHTKLYPGYVLCWKEFRIAIRLDDDDKRRALIVDRMRPGSLGNNNMPHQSWVGSTK